MTGAHWVPQSVAAILEKSSKHVRFTQRVREYRLRLAWMKAMGPVIAHHAQPVKFAQGVLTVHASSAVWIQELHLMVPEILARLRRHPVGRSVEKIRFRIGTVEPVETPPPDPRERLSEIAMNPEELARLDQVCSSVADPELRSIIRRVAEKDARLRRVREKDASAYPVTPGRE